MPEFPEELFSQLYRRAPTDVDRDRLLSVKASLGLSARDELWPLILALDHYTSTSQAARSATVKEAKYVIEALKEIPQKAGPIAAAEAQKAISKAVDQAADKIAKVSVTRTQAHAERLSKSQYITMLIAGAALAITLTFLGSFGTYQFLKMTGICAEDPEIQNGIEFCVVDRNPLQ